MPDDGQKTCPKHVEFYSKIKSEKLVHLVGFIIRIYHDTWSSECKNMTCVFVYFESDSQIIGTWSVGPVAADNVTERNISFTDELDGSHYNVVLSVEEKGSSRIPEAFTVYFSCRSLPKAFSVD